MPSAGGCASASRRCLAGPKRRPASARRVTVVWPASAGCSRSPPRPTISSGCASWSAPWGSHARTLPRVRPATAKSTKIDAETCFGDRSPTTYASISHWSPTNRSVRRFFPQPASSLLVAAALVVVAYVVANPLLRAVAVPFAEINLPLGLAAMFLGVFTVAVRREAVPQLLGLLAIENGVCFTGVAIVPSLPVIAELAAAVDMPVITLVVGLLTRQIHQRLGTTAVGQLSALREH